MVTVTVSHVCILMATYNGEQFLAEQLLSIESQTHHNWKVIASDDGSNDNTIQILKDFQDKWGLEKLEIRNGPKQGYCHNFLSLACDSNIKADYYAFSDQDDVWMPDKLSRALSYLDSIPNSDIPTIFCGRTQLVDKSLKHIGLSPLFALPKSFRNALVQSIAGGNTMVFNQATKILLELAGSANAVSHDWWVYQITTGAGGGVYYDPQPSVLYRQHADALVGSNNSILAKLERIHYVLNGRFKEWNTINYKALFNVKHLLTKDCQEILETYGKFRNAKLKDRIRLLEVCGLYRQTKFGTLSLWLATIIKKI